MNEEKIKEYLKGYREGFESALKMAWAYAEELHVRVDNADKPLIKEYIDKLKS